LKATALASDLALTAAEMAYLATAAGLTAGGQNWLAALPVDAPAPPASFPEVTKVLDGLLSFAALKASYSPLSSKPPQLLTTLQDMTVPASATTATAALLALTGWDGPSLQALLPRLFNVTTLAALPDPLPSATTLIGAATNDPAPNPASTVLSDFQSAVRSRYAETDWLSVVQPINDSLRESQRNALVAYILAQSGPAILAALGIAAAPGRVATPDDLFSYFLLDVEMEPCMQTSRIRLALSSVQLFIERCLRSLEPAVSPADIGGPVTAGPPPAAQWDWRKRYRVWQANREVFLWPENWLDPSLRDDKSPFFQTTMSQLLQSDITDDSAAGAYLDYLSNLEGVAKLDPCGLYYQPAPAGSAHDLAHVIARTGGANRKYYHRRLEGGAWTPWEEIKLSIEDNPVIPYVWNGRLLLLWLQLQHKPAASPANLPQIPPGGPHLADSSLSDLSGAAAASAPNLTSAQVCAVLCFSEYYNGAWQPAKTSDVSNPLSLGQWPQGTLDRSQLFLCPWTAADTTDESLYVQVQAGGVSEVNPIPPPLQIVEPAIEKVQGFVLHNTHSAPVKWADVSPTVDVSPTSLAFPTYARILRSGGSPPRTLTALYAANLATPGSPGFDQSRTMLVGRLPQDIVTTQSDVDDQWYMPFFFGDSRRVFYVTPSLSWESLGRSVEFSGFALSPRPASAAKDAAGAIPPLVVHQGPAQPGAPAGITAGPVSASIAHSAVTADGLRAVIGGGTAITFQGRSIGVTGSVAATPQATTETG
jgi:hypothetical protein